MRESAHQALSIIIAGSNQIDVSRTVDALTAVIMYLHGDHFWPVMEAHKSLPWKHLIRLGCHLSGRHGGLGVGLRGRGDSSMKGGRRLIVSHGPPLIQKKNI